MTTQLPLADVQPATSSAKTVGAAPRQLGLPLQGAQCARPVPVGVLPTPIGCSAPGHRAPPRRAPPRRAPPRRVPVGRRPKARALRSATVLVVVPPGRRAPREAVLRQALVMSGVPHRCSRCDVNGSWLGGPLPLVIDHLNGDHRDNRRHNLRFLCPNCRAQSAAGPRRGDRRAAELPRGQPVWQQQELFDLAA